MAAKSCQHDAAKGARNSLSAARSDSSKPPASSFLEFEPSRSRSFTLSKAERLCSHKIIQQLFNEGRSVKDGPLLLAYLPSPLPSLYPAQISFAVSKKNFKRAVDRNRIKRLMREAYRQHKHPLYERLLALKQQHAFSLIYRSRNLPTYAEVEQSLLSLIEQFLHENPA